MNVQSFRRSLKREGLRAFNSFLPDIHSDPISFLLQDLFLVAIFLSTVMLFIGWGGPLYSSMRLPLTNNFLVLAGDKTALSLASQVLDPEMGMHWTTVLIYSWFAHYLLKKLPKLGFSPVHTWCFTGFLFMAAFVFPFEWIYTTLLDIFHNMPVEGVMTTTTYGLWRPFPSVLINSVIGRNGLMAVGGMLGAYIIAADNYYNHPQGYTKFKFININRKTIALAAIFIGLFALWIALPAVTPQGTFPPESNKGTIWFPQSIYVWYAYDPHDPSDLYNIVRQLWVPNATVENFSNVTGLPPLNPTPEPLGGALVRIVNNATKLFTVWWVAATFTPRPVRDDVKSKVLNKIKTQK